VVAAQNAISQHKDCKICVPCTAAPSAKHALRFCHSGCFQLRSVRTLGWELGMHKFPACRAHGKVRRNRECGRRALVDTLWTRCEEMLPQFDVMMEQEEAVSVCLK
jgi:hypothetical protein